MLMSLGSHLQWAPAVQKSAPPAISFTMIQLTEPFSEDALPLAPSAPGPRDWTSLAFLGLWACGFAGVALIRFRGWLRIRAALRASTPIDLFAAVAVRSSPGLLEPGVVGWWRPILLLPAGIAERLTPPQLEAVLAHELCHVRRRDNLFAAIHMIVEATFWFHPLVWWIGARLVEERERACDEEVLRLGSQPRIYAEGILNVCKLYAESPLACVSGVTGSDLKKRIEGIMTNRRVLQLNFSRKVALASAGAVALTMPVVVGIMHAPFVRAQSQSVKFEFASITPGCGGSSGIERKTGASDGAIRGGPPAPGTLNSCATLENHVRMAYFQHRPANPEGYVTHVPVPVEGGPDWIHSDHYQITAKAQGAPSQEMMWGPMLQALLADRFQLKIRTETRVVPVYDLTVAAGGLILQPFVEGSCTPEPDYPVAHTSNLCGIHFGLNGSNLTMDLRGFSLDQFCRFLRSSMDRTVTNQTGVPGKFDIHLEFTPDPTGPGFLVALARSRRFADAGGDRSAPVAPSIYTAVQQQAGLKLEPAIGPGEVLVIDHVERPAGN
jgi:bla regulator protein blaR1